LKIEPEAIAAPKLFDLLAPLVFPSAEIEAANVHICGRDDGGRRAASKAEHYSVFDCANPCEQIASVICRGEPHPHDGGVAAVHLGCDLKNHQQPNDATVEDSNPLFAVLEARR